MDQTVQPEVKKSNKDLSTPLSVKCDQEQKLTSPVASSQQDTSRNKLNDTLSPAIWPTFADLIEDTPQIEDTEDDELEAQGDHKDVEIDNKELENMLTQAVSVTKGCSLLSLMDLYGQLNRVVIKYSRTHDRNNLPQELEKEISRFQETQKRPFPGSKNATS